jgi:uncharacterized phage protein gp47/JayE
MAYFKPYIDESGLHIPTYNDILGELLNEARAIFGADIYLENDGQDYEYISLMSDRIHDAFLTAQLVYNNRGPSTAIGAALDGLVKLNGIKRKRATQSTADVILTGTPGAAVINGFVMDENNINWDLETPLVFNVNGTIETLATCQRIGPVLASAGQINKIGTPTSGWVSVTNPEAAIPGLPVEGQEQLRARQTISTANPSRTVLEGTSGAIAAVLDVTRHMVYENDTNIFGYPYAPNWGRPIEGHTIAAVVEGGKDYDIAYAIYTHKGPGCGTQGTEEIVINITEIAGLPNETPIRFYRPTYYDITVTVTVKRLPGYVSQITENIKANVAAYLNSLSIGDNLTLSALWGAALTAMPDLTRPLFSITSVTAGMDSAAEDTVDIEVPFNCVTRGDVDNITVLYV